MGVKQASHTSHTGPAVGHYPLKYFGEGPKEYDNTKERRRVISGLAWLVQDIPSALFKERGWKP